MNPLDDVIDDLDEMLADIFRRLRRACKDRRSAMHTPVVGSVRGDGTPSQRVMVMRAFDPASAMLRFHTDARTAKIDEIGKGAPISVLAYDPGARRQFRLSGMGRIEADGETADAAWGASTLFARRCYLAEPAPGSASDTPVSGLPADIEGRKPRDEAEVAPGRANFAVLLAAIDTIEFLHLAHTGHRRAIYRRADDGSWRGQWLVP